MAVQLQPLPALMAMDTGAGDLPGYAGAKSWSYQLI